MLFNRIFKTYKFVYNNSYTVLYMYDDEWRNKSTKNSIEN